jgi:hypothetical protein
MVQQFLISSRFFERQDNWRLDLFLTFWSVSKWLDGNLVPVQHFLSLTIRADIPEI